MTIKQFTDQEGQELFLHEDEYFDLSFLDYLNGDYPRHVTELEASEAVNDTYPDEEAVSEAFDAMVFDQGLIQWTSNGETFTDEPAMREWFNHWTDSECKEGNLSDVQYSEYAYIGKYKF